MDRFIGALSIPVLSEQAYLKSNMDTFIVAKEDAVTRMRYI